MDRIKAKTLFFAIFLISIVFLLTLSFSTSILAHVNDEWDWNQPGRRTLNYSFAPGTPQDWINWTRKAADNINKARTGWVLQEGSFEGDHIKITVLNKSHPKLWAETNYGDRRGRNDSRLTYRNITVYANTTSRFTNVTWGTSGNRSMNPIINQMHEMMHALRLRHDNRSTIIKVPGRWGVHNTTLSPADLQQLRDAANSTSKFGKANVSRAGTNTSVRAGIVNFRIIIPPNGVTRNGSISFHPYFWDMWPSASFPLVIKPPVNTPVPIVSSYPYLFAYGVDIKPIDTEIHSMRLIGSYPDFMLDAIPGSVPESILRPQLNEYQMKAFHYDPISNDFTELPSVVDPVKNRIEIQIQQKQFSGFIALFAAQR